MITSYPREQITSRLKGLRRFGEELIVEPTIYTVGLLAENWKQGGWDPSKVIIDLYKNWVHVDFTDQNYVLIYPVNGSEQPVGLGYTHSNDTDRLSIQIVSRGDDIHFALLVARVRQIILANRRTFYKDGNGASIGGATWVKWGISKSPEDKIRKGHTVRTYDIEIRRRWRPIKNAG